MYNNFIQGNNSSSVMMTGMGFAFPEFLQVYYIICTLFKTADQYVRTTCTSIALNDWMAVNTEMERMQKEAIMA